MGFQACGFLQFIPFSGEHLKVFAHSDGFALGAVLRWMIFASRLLAFSRRSERQPALPQDEQNSLARF
jgi:hypothetical protein